MIDRAKRIAGLLLLLALTSSVSMAAFTNYSQDVANTGAPSPVDRITGSSINQFGAGQTNSQVDNYLNQDEQINVDPKDGVLKVLRTNQKDLINNYVPAMIPVVNVSPRELRPIARAITAIEGGRAEIVQDKEKKQYFVYVVCPPWQLASVEKAIHDLDASWLNATDDGSSVVVHAGKFRDVSQIDPIVRVYTGGTSTLDQADNTATNLNDPALAEMYLKISNEVDIPAHQITVEAKFVEVSTTNEMKLGVDYINWKNGPGRNLFEFLCGAVDNDEEYRGASSIFNPLTPHHAPEGTEEAHSDIDSHQKYANFNAWLTSAYVDFLQSKGKAKVLVSPIITTESGQLAQWASVDQIVTFADSGTDQKVPYGLDDKRATEEEPDSTGDLGAWDRFVNYVKSPNAQAGVFLTVEPFIGTESTEMFVSAEISSVTGYLPTGLPVLARRSVISNVRTRDGETLFLSGLSRCEKVKQKIGMPWLMDIPGLGYLFGGETSIDNRTNVVVTLNTHTSLNSASKMDAPVRLAEAKAQVEGTKDLVIPTNHFGFDQWLLDPAKRKNTDVPVCEAGCPPVTAEPVAAAPAK